MDYGKKAAGVSIACMLMVCAPMRGDEQALRLVGGELRVYFNAAAFEALSPMASRNGQLLPVAENESTVLSFALDAQSDFVAILTDGVLTSLTGTILVEDRLHLLNDRGTTTAILPALIAGDEAGDWIVFDASHPELDAFVIRAPTVHVDAAAGTLLITGDNVELSPGFAARIGLHRLAGATVARVALRARLRDSAGPRSPGASASQKQIIAEQTEAAETAPDLIVADLHAAMANYGQQDGVSAFAIGTTSCNIGTIPAMWIANTNEHPVILQNLYRLENDRFEQIGMAWLKHGFGALQETVCCPANDDCCEDPGVGNMLGVNCSDPYAAQTNGRQAGMGPRSMVNAYTGYFPPPGDEAAPETILERRLQVGNEEIDSAWHPEALYFGEGHYVSADDALGGNGENNAAYRQYVFFWSAAQNMYFGQAPPGSATVRQQPAIRAWQASDPSVEQVDMRVPGEGLFILAGKATDLMDGSWEYEYALHNLNSHRSAGSFRVPIPRGTVPTGIGFHDVDYHSGEVYDVGDWPATVSGNAIEWATTPYAENENANALRWGTLYNFRFQADVPPAETSVTIGLFRPGFPQTISASIIGPALEMVDCNKNGIDDSCDVSCGAEGCVAPCGEHVDCDNNGVPDDCEPDCNENTRVDACDVSSGDSPDVNENGAPDECECFPAAPATHNPATPDGGRGSAPRFLSFLAGEPEKEAAIRVRFPDPMPPPYESWSGLDMWAGPPTRYCENSGNGAAPDNVPPTYGCDAAPGLDERWSMVSTLQCEPFYMDWHGYCDTEITQCIAPFSAFGVLCSGDADCDTGDGGNGLCSSVCWGGLRAGYPCVESADCAGPLYVFHEGIIPSTGPHNEQTITPTTYAIQVAGPNCNPAYSNSYSLPLQYTTSKWGDTVEDLQTSPYPPPEGVVSIADVLAILNKFRNLGTASVSARVDLLGAVAPKYLPDHQIDILDVLQALFAFQAVKYPPPAIPDVPNPRPCAAVTGR